MNYEMKSDIHSDSTKYCRDCGVIKLLNEFPKNKNASDGRHCICKKCCCKRTAIWKISNPDKVKAAAEAKKAKRNQIRDEKIANGLIKPLMAPDERKQREKQQQKIDSKRFRERNREKHKNLSDAEIRCRIGSKLCRKCNIEKSTIEFSMDRGANDGLQPYCKTCHTQSTLTWQKRNPDKIGTTAKRNKKYYSTLLDYEIQAITTVKICGRCKKEKSGNEFHIDRGNSDGLCYSCKECNCEHNAMWRVDQQIERAKDPAGYQQEQYNKKVIREENKERKFIEQFNRVREALERNLAKLASEQSNEQ